MLDDVYLTVGEVFTSHPGSGPTVISSYSVASFQLVETQVMLLQVSRLSICGDFASTFGQLHLLA
jgi:hypothetical protein